jgi:uncharacterized membrane protein
LEANKRMNMIVLSIMAAITLFNMGLAVNFFAASGRALAALFTNESIFLFAGVELIVVLLAYILHRQKTGSITS